MLGGVENRPNSIWNHVLLILSAKNCIGRINLINLGKEMSLILLEWNI